MASFYLLVELIQDFCHQHEIDNEDGALLLVDILKILDISLSDEAVRQIEEVVSRDF